MTETPSASQPAEETPTPPKARAKHFMWHVPVHKFFLLVSWVFPLVIMGVGYVFFPSLRSPMSWPWDAPPDIWLGICVQLIMMLVWLLYEIWYTTHRNAAVHDLQLDCAVDLVVALALMLVMGATIVAGKLQWWFLAPMIGALIDVFQATLLGINNAAEKPYVSTKGST
jgi:hypothetical protein